jgi:hypothetical protein
VGTHPGRPDGQTLYELRVQCGLEILRLQFFTTEEVRQLASLMAGPGPSLAAGAERLCWPFNLPQAPPIDRFTTTCSTTAVMFAILTEYKKYLPLTDRQIHYYLLNDPPLIHAGKPDSVYENNRQSYKCLCDLLTRARLERHIPFASIHDPTRPAKLWNFFESVQPFVRRELDQFLKGYYRDLMQSQPNHIEIVYEKLTVQNILQPVASHYGIPMVPGRGYADIGSRHQMKQRFLRSGKSNLVLLVVSDFDPEGDDIPESFAKSMRDDFGIGLRDDVYGFAELGDIEAVKVALTYDQTQEMDLVSDELTRPKRSSSRYKKFTRRYGRDVSVYELEALHPEDLQSLLRNAIDKVIDVDAFNAEVDREKEDAAFLDGVRRTVQAMLGDIPELRDEEEQD